MEMRTPPEWPYRVPTGSPPRSTQDMTHGTRFKQVSRSDMCHRRMALSYVQRTIATNWITSGR
jgi:hypothetical protein